MTSSASCASRSWARRSSTSASGSRIKPASAISRLSATRQPRRARPRHQIEPDQHFFRIGEIADDAAQRMGKNLEQGGHGDDLLLLACLRMQIDVDDLKGVTLGNILGANPAHVLDRQDGARGLAAYVETQHVSSVR